MAKSSGGQRESDGVVVVMIGVKLKASGAKGPGFGHGWAGGKR
jgi:RNA-directed DNA polymerase